ncbi:hypothetical protein NMY22_g1597 [Coprinellus aureogranulatus]|nr:hypothetical protein NMY22_g1597 [Coprinellus aureogranulatus]
MDLRRPSSLVLAFQFLDDDQDQHIASRNEVFVLTIMMSGKSFAGFKLSYFLGIREPASLTLAPPSQRLGQSQGTIVDSNARTSMRRRSRREARHSQSEIESFTSSDPESGPSSDESADEEIALPNCVLFLVEALTLEGYGKSNKPIMAGFQEMVASLTICPVTRPHKACCDIGKTEAAHAQRAMQATAGSQIAISGRQPLSVRRPKSLQHARQWRDMGKPTSPAAPRLPRVDIHVMTQRNALRGDGYTEFRQFFKYDALPDPEAQLALADIYDNPVLTAVTPDGEFDNTDLTERAGRKIVKAPPDQQPSFVVHPLYWEGKLGEHPTEAIKQSMSVLVTVLTIDHSSIVLNDVDGRGYIVIFTYSPIIGGPKRRRRWTPFPLLWALLTAAITSESVNNYLQKEEKRLAYLPLARRSLISGVLHSCGVRRAGQRSHLASNFNPSFVSGKFQTSDSRYIGDEPRPTRWYRDPLSSVSATACGVPRLRGTSSEVPYKPSRLFSVTRGPTDPGPLDLWTFVQSAVPPDRRTFQLLDVLAKSLSALTLTSCVPLDPVFNTVKFPASESISLMLRGSASSTGFDGLIKQFQGRHAPPLKMFTLRGGLQQESLDQLVDLLEARTIPFRQYLT